MHTIEAQSVIHSTFVIERTYSAPLERVFGAFADPAQKRRWFVESSNHEVEEYEMDFRVGGQERSRVRFKEGTPLIGITCVNETRYADIVPNRRLVLASKMSLGDHCISASLVTVEFLRGEAKTDVILTHQAAFFEGADGPQMREAGWRKLLERLGEEFSS
jgi:uncharacterized protein YndB with AHSA1/START domain